MRRGARNDDDPTVASSSGGGIEAVLAETSFHGIGTLLPPDALAELGKALLRRPAVPAGHVATLAADLARIVRGRPTAATLDARFADRAWRENPLLQRLALAYLSLSHEVQAIVDESDLDPRTRRKLQLPVDNLLAALAPTNNPLTNPTAWKELVDTGGRSLRRGLNNLAHDLRSVTKLPTSVDRSAFVIGETIAATPGAVVRRERLYELLEFDPMTDEVDVVPTVIVASPVNKHYLIDLAPQESILRSHLERGRRVFVPAWVNPDESHADAGFDAYVASILEVIETATSICGSDRVHLVGLCGGGQLALLTAGYLAAVDRASLLRTLTIAIAIADFHGEDGSLIDARSGEAAIRRAKKHGYFKATDQSYSFAFMRPEESIWINVINQYFLGRSPAAVPIIAWAVDQTNLSTQFGTDMIRVALDNSLAKPGGTSILGVPIDLRQVATDTYVLGASLDHISPWKDCFRTVGMLGGSTRFVLAEGGHAISIARRMDHPRGSYFTSDVATTDPDRWLTSAERRVGSWWGDWERWVTQRAPETTSAPTRRGSDAWPAIEPAPGQYVRRVVT